MVKKYMVSVLLVSLLFLAGCAQSVSEVKTQENIGEKVTVKGTVNQTLKIGSISGYVLVGEDGEKIAVSSQELPAEGEEVRVTGTLQDEFMIGYMIVVE